MKKLLVAALTHQDAFRLERLIVSVAAQFQSIFEVHGLVVCNTQNTDYPVEAKKVADTFGWEFVQTESNGKPGKGKNSVLEIFQNRTEFDYLLMMDGDDMLYPTALHQLEAIVRGGADVVGLLTNDIVDTKFYADCAHTRLGEKLFLYSWFDRQVQWTAEADINDAVNRAKPLGEQNTPDRIVLLSRKADFLRCSEELPVYEDYVLSLRTQAAMLEGKLTYVHVGSTYIYVYDKTNQMSTCKMFDIQHKGNWSAYEDVFRKEIENLEPILQDFETKEVPFVTIQNPKNFTTEMKLKFLSHMFYDFKSSI